MPIFNDYSFSEYIAEYRVWFKGLLMIGVFAIKQLNKTLNLVEFYRDLPLSTQIAFNSFTKLRSNYNLLFCLCYI